MLGVFSIDEPTTVQEASNLLDRFGTDATAYAGGTELLALMKEGLVRYSRLVDLKSIPGLAEVSIDDERRTLTIGALATHRELARSRVVNEYAPLLAGMEARVANVRVRAAGTIGGNLCFAEPHSDPATLLMAWGALLELASARGVREAPIEDFFVGFLETARRPDEILTAVRVPLQPGPGAGGAYEKFSLHERPTVTVAALLQLQAGLVSETRLAVGSAGPVPLRIGVAEQFLHGVTPAEHAFAEAGELAARAIDPVNDLYGSVEYKRHLVRVLVKSALSAAAQQAMEGEAA